MKRLTSAAIGFLSLCALFLSAAQGQHYVISTYAGGEPPSTPVSGVNLYIEGGGTLGIIADAAGNTYFTGFHCVFKLDQDGIVTRIAGTSRPGYSGDGGPALRAQLQLPSYGDFFESGLLLPAGVAVDHAGNVFIGDNGNNRIRKISSDGIITTVAGNGESGRSGDGGLATSAQLTVPFSLAVDRRANLFIADHINHVVRKVSPDGIITTVAGNGIKGFSGDGNPAISAQLSYPSGLAVDDEGNLLIADTGNGRIRKVSPDGIISTVAGGGRCCISSGDGGPATLAFLSTPTNVAVDPAGNLFITDTNYDWYPDYYIQVVRKVSTDGTIATVAGSGRRCFSNAGSSDCDGDGGPAVRAGLSGALGLAVDPAGNLLIADTGNNRIRKVYSDGIITTVVGGGARIPGDGGAAALANLFHPTAAAVDPAGNLFIADGNAHRIRKVSPDGIITTVAGNGTNGWCATPPCPSGDGGAATAASLAYPTGLALDGTGNVFFIDSIWRLRKISPDGIISIVAGNGIAGFSGDGGPAIDAQLTSGRMAADGTGNLFFGDYGGRIRKVSAAGIITTVAHGGYFSPAVDNRGNLFIGGRAHVSKVSDDGTITTVAGNGTPGYSGDGGPATDAQLTVGSIAVDSAGNLFIADYTQTRIRKVSPAGIITTVAGNGTLGYSGDGGPATDAQLSARSITVDGTGNVYVVDWFNNAVRILRPINGPF